MPDGRTIEEHYQCDVKGYDPGGTRWKLGKGKPPKLPLSSSDLYTGYLKLWKVWAQTNAPLLQELRQHALANGGVLSDRFATSEVNQAHALADILNSMDTISPALAETPQSASVPPPAATQPESTKISPDDAHGLIFEHLEVAGVHADVYCKFHETQKAAFLEMPASIGKHHCWPGGYAVHIAEVVSNLVRLVKADMYPDSKRVPLVDAIIAAYIHDLDKLLIRYVRDTDAPTGPQLGKAKAEGVKITPKDTKASLSKKIDAAVKGEPPPRENELPMHKFNPSFPAVDDSAAVAFLCMQHGLVGLNWDIMHAVSIHHGGYSPLARTSNHMKASPLAILLHAADQMSSGIQEGSL